MYFESVISEDLETQRKGLVVAFFARENPLKQSQMVRMEEHQLMYQLKNSMPLRWSALHISLPDGPFVKIHKAFMLLGFGRDARIRSRVYPGFSLETQYKLLTYGINAGEFPLTHSGSIKVKNHMQWLKIRRVVENERSQGRLFIGISVPGVYDVLFSKGGNKNHHGNHEFKCIIETLLSQERYQNMFPKNRKDRRIVDRGQREAIRYDILRQVKARNGRFLALNKGGWWTELPLDSDDLTEKIATSVYDHFKRLEARRKQRKTKSDTGDFMDSPLRQMYLKNSHEKCGGSFRACM
jgi:hypothetical protein